MGEKDRDLEEEGEDMVLIVDKYDNVIVDDNDNAVTTTTSTNNNNNNNNVDIDNSRKAMTGFVGAGGLCVLREWLIDAITPLEEMNDDNKSDKQNENHDLIDGTGTRNDSNIKENNSIN